MGKEYPHFILDFGTGPSHYAYVCAYINMERYTYESKYEIPSNPSEISKHLLFVKCNYQVEQLESFQL